MEELKAIEEQLQAAQEDGVKFFEKGNAAAGKRVRAAMQEIKKLAQALRVKVSEQKNQEK